MKTENFALENLRENEELFRITFEQADVGIAHVSPEGKFIRINQKFCDIVKYSKDEMLSINFQEITYADDLKEDLQNLEKLLKGDIKTFVREKRYICKDKTIVWVNLTVSLIRDIKNKPKFIITFVQDITKRKSIENALAESESRYKNIIENTTDIIIVTGFDGKHLYVSSRYQELLGRTPEQINKFLIEYIHPDDQKKLKNLYIESFQKRYAPAPDTEFEFRIQHQDGHYIWVSSISKNYYDEKGKVVGIITSLRDIRERKEAEERLKQSELRYKNIIENTTEAITVVNFNGKAIYVSPKHEKLTGRNLGEVNQLPINYIHPEDRSKLIEQYEKSFMNQQVVAPNTEFEYRILHKNGSYRWFSSMSNNYYDENGQIIGIITSMRDISKRKEMEKNLSKSEQKYHHLFESSPYIIGLINKNGTIIDCNSSVSNFFSLQKEDLIGRSIYEVFSDIEENENLIPIFQKLIDKAYSEIQGKSFEFKLYRSSEQFVWLSVESSFTEIENQLLIQFIMQDITEKKIIEETLKESEIKFRTIAEQSFLGISILQNGIFKYYNDKMTEINGYRREDIQDWQPYEYLKIIHPDDLQNATEQARKNEIGETEFLTYTKYRIITKSGEIRWTESFSKPINYEGRTADLIMSKDITEEVLADFKLKESELKFRTIAEQSFMGIIIIQDGEFKYFNQRAADINGHSVEEIKKWEPYEFMKLIHPEDKDLVLDQVRKKQEGDKNVINRYKYRIIKKSGEVAWMDNYSKTITFNERPADLVMTEDITEKIISEQQLKESELKFRKIFEANPSGMHLFDLNQDDELIFKGANPAADKILKINSQVKIGLSFDEVFPYLVETDIPPKYKNVALSGDSLNWEYTYKNNEGINRTYDIYSFQTAPRSIVSSFLDVTDRIEAEERLREVNKLKSDLLRRASHELKTPLTSINGAADLLLTTYQGDFSEKSKKFLRIIKNGSERLENLIKDLLAVSRLTTQNVEIQKHSDDIVKLMKNSIKEVEIFAFERKIEINFNQVESVYINVDKNKILQVFANLLMNAIKYTPPLGKVIVSLKVHSNNIEYFIKDTGIGFTEEEKNGLFKQFGKIERFGHGYELNTEGSGLGLYISKELIELHSGELLLESEGRNKGSTFIIRLPKF